jgi:hypothetical protein
LLRGEIGYQERMVGMEVGTDLMKPNLGEVVEVRGAIS